ncbi:gastrin/cholecystokinin-like peptide [Apteryx rowi]|uniref:gastrin/cholecystokinin-like peptide n=1 Tax=Apteryx rowi TaxID=308060 RepID=UPI000E1D8974|nr:gastrin/cholecystokinin-like peptide [Apteryx rowi]
MHVRVCLYMCVSLSACACACGELSTHHGDEGSEALHDLYYYPGWMDFGRRSAEDLAGVA